MDGWHLEAVVGSGQHQHRRKCRRNVIRLVKDRLLLLKILFSGTRRTVAHSIHLRAHTKALLFDIAKPRQPPLLPLSIQPELARLSRVLGCIEVHVAPKFLFFNARMVIVLEIVVRADAAHVVARGVEVEEHGGPGAQEWVEVGDVERYGV